MAQPTWHIVEMKIQEVIYCVSADSEAEARRLHSENESEYSYSETISTDITDIFKG